MPIETGLIVCTNEYDRKDAYDLHMILESYKTPEYLNHQISCRQNENFSFGKQWDADEITENKAQGNYTIVINMVTKSLDFLAGTLTAQRPKMLAVPVSPECSYQSNLALKIYDWHYEKNHELRQTSQWVHDALNHNISYKHVYADESGEPCTEILSYEDVIIDPASRDYLFKDARRIFIRKVMSAEEACAKYGIQVQLSASPTKFFNNDYGSENYVKGSVAVAATDTAAAIERKTNYYSTVEVGQVFSSNGYFVEIYESLAKYKVKVNGKIKDRIVMESLIGYEYVYREVLPESITDYGLIPLTVRKGRNPYGIGITEMIKEPQKFLNKINGVMLKNATTVGFPKTLIPRNMIPNNNFKKFKEDFNRPNAVLEYNPIGNDAASQIKTIQGQPVSDAIIQMYNSALTLMEFNTAPKESMGFQNSTKNAVGDPALQKDMAIDSMKMISRNLEDSTNQHARVVLQYAKAYTPKDKIVEISCGMNALERVQLNRKMKLDPKNEESVKAFIDAGKQAGKHITEIEDMIAKAKDDDGYLDSIANFIVNDSSELNVVLKMVSDSFNSSQQNSEYGVLRDLVSLGATIPPEMLLENSSVSNKEEIKSKISAVTKLQSEFVQMNEQLAQFQAEIKKKDDEILQLKQNVILTEHEAKMQKIETDERAKVKNNVTSHRAALGAEKMHFNTQAEKILFTLEKLLEDVEDDVKDENASPDKKANIKNNIMKLISGE